jgi:hypothetical protein
MKTKELILACVIVLYSTVSYSQTKSPVVDDSPRGVINRLYDKNSSYKGYEVKSGDKTRIYNEKSEYQGYEIKSGNTTRIYDSSSRYKGYKKGK